MTRDHEKSLEVIRWLVDGCLKSTPRSDCPFNVYREMSKKERWDTIQLLSPEQVQDILKTHIYCDNDDSDEL